MSLAQSVKNGRKDVLLIITGGVMGTIAAHNVRIYVHVCVCACVWVSVVCVCVHANVCVCA